MFNSFTEPFNSVRSAALAEVCALLSVILYVSVTPPHHTLAYADIRSHDIGGQGLCIARFVTQFIHQFFGLSPCISPEGGPG